MPRGIPNVKRDDTGLRYTSFHVPLLQVLVLIFDTPLNGLQAKSKAHKHQLSQIRVPDAVVSQFTAEA